MPNFWPVFNLLKITDTVFLFSRFTSKDATLLLEIDLFSLGLTHGRHGTCRRRCYNQVFYTVLAEAGII